MMAVQARPESTVQAGDVGPVGGPRVAPDAISRPPLLDIRDVTKTFVRRRIDDWWKGGTETRALDHVSLSLERAKVLGIVGESGSGKSTLANIVLGLETQDSGNVRFDGREISSLRGADLKAFRRQVQVVFQDPNASLDPRFTVGRSIEEPLVIHRIGDAAERRKRVEAVLEETGLSPAAAYLSRFPHELSGGQRQRVAIARAIILEPALLIADEPVSMLDVSVRAGILKLLGRLVQTHRMAMVFITHDLSIIRYVCDDLAILYRGKLVEKGPAAAVMDDPRDAYTRALIAAVPVPEVTSRGAQRPQTMNDDAKQLLRWIDDDRQTLLDFYAGFVRAKSPNPPGDTRAAIRHVASFLDGLKLPYTIHEPLDGAPNIVASFEGAGRGPHLILNGHADVFPIGREDLWERDPFSGLIEDGRIHGRGSSDMKGGSTAAVFAYAYLHRLKERIPGKLTLMIVSDEETGGTWGSKWLIDNLGEQVLGDCVLSGEPGGVGTVRYGEKGIFQFTVSVKTRGAHGPYPHLSKNAIRIASSIMDELETLQAMVPELPPAVARSLDQPRTRELIEKTMGAGTADVMRQLTVNIGTIRGGSKVNMVAADCTMEVDIRIPIGIDSDAVLSRVQEILAKHPEAKLENLHKGSPNHCDPEHRMARIVDASARAVGLEPLVPIPSLGGSDCRLWRERGIPAYIFGTTPHNIAAPNEWTSIEDFLQVVRVHALSSYTFLAGEA